MKKLVIIRHAKSDWSTPEQDDFDRELNKRGMADAPMMGKVLNDKKLIPDLVLCSSAVRASLTCKKLISHLPYKQSDVLYLSELYHAEVEKILNIINQQTDQVETLFLIGHNPGITHFVNLVANEDITNVPTTGICIIGVESFAHLNFSEGKLLEFIYPKMFK